MPPPKPWSIDTFEKFRPELCSFLREKIVIHINDFEIKRILIRAPVKSGKREMVEYLAQRDTISKSKKRHHIFASAFHRTADETQRDEMKKFNIDVHSITDPIKTQKCINEIQKKISNGNDIVIHIDEADFGTGHTQRLSELYSFIKDNDKITTILYTATPEEALYSDEFKSTPSLQEFVKESESVEYNPPSVFCGPNKFLDEGLIEDATPFFTILDGRATLTDQGKEIVQQLKENATDTTSKRNIGLLRLSYSNADGKVKKENKAIYQFIKNCRTIPELDEVIICFDKSEKEMPKSGSKQRMVLDGKIQWSNPDYWILKTTTRPIIVVADQTCSRSTELACHDRLCFQHDYRKSVVFTTTSQAQERVNHYSTKYPGGFQPIKIYGHKKTFELSARRITYDAYMKKNEWMKKKVDRRHGLSDELYEIKTTTQPYICHPEYRGRYTLDEANRILQDIGCSTNTTISSRVNGGVTEKKTFKTNFCECNKDNFNERFRDKLRELNITSKNHNPFNLSEKQGKTPEGKYKGCWRSSGKREWRVLDYHRDIESSHDKQAGGGIGESGCRIVICYQNESLGVAIIYDSGETETVNTLETHNSMYGQ